MKNLFLFSFISVLMGIAQAHAGQVYSCVPKEKVSGLNTFVFVIRDGGLHGVTHTDGVESTLFEIAKYKSGAHGKYTWYSLSNNNESQSHLLAVDKEMFSGEGKVTPYLLQDGLKRVNLKCTQHTEMKVSALALYNIALEVESRDNSDGNAGISRVFQEQDSDSDCTEENRRQGFCAKITAFAKTCVKGVLGAACGSVGGFAAGVKTAYLIDMFLFGGALNSGYPMAVAIAGQFFAPMVQGFTLFGATVGTIVAISDDPFGDHDLEEESQEVRNSLPSSNVATYEKFVRWCKTHLGAQVVLDSDGHYDVVIPVDKL